MLESQGDVEYGLNHLSLRQFRCFESQEFKLAKRLNLFIGDNRTGKTTILRGVATILNPLVRAITNEALHIREIEFSSRGDNRLKLFLHGNLPTYEPQKADCNAEMWTPLAPGAKSVSVGIEGHKISVSPGEFHGLGESVKSGAPQVLPLFLCHLASADQSSPSYREVQSNLDIAENLEVVVDSDRSRLSAYRNWSNPSQSIDTLFTWFKNMELDQLQSGSPISQYLACLEAIKSCLPGARRVFWNGRYDELSIEFDEDSMELFSNLSDGFRRMIKLIGNLAYRCAVLNPQLEGDCVRLTPGIVCIDEVDTHLHPSWQRIIVPALLNAFPSVQFFLTTHSPFVIQSIPSHPDYWLHNLDTGKSRELEPLTLDEVVEDIQGVESPDQSVLFQTEAEALTKAFSGPDLSSFELTSTDDPEQNQKLPTTSPVSEALLKLKQAVDKERGL